MNRDTRLVEVDSSLLRAKYVSLRTFRPDGSSSSCPVWAAADEGRIVFRTFARTLKVARLARDPRVELAACDRGGVPTGHYVRGVARRVRGTEAGRARWRLLGRQGPMIVAADLWYRWKLGAIAYYAIDPAPAVEGSGGW